MKKKVAFETAMSKLEGIVNKLESGEESLENSLKLFEEGTKIASYCYTTLAEAEQKITELSQIEKMKSVKSGD